MAAPDPSELLARLRDNEDQFTERKPEGAGGSAFKKALVAFANTLPPNRTGILFIGISDTGDILGVADPNQLQRTLRKLAENDCYPPIYVDLAIVSADGKQVVAAVVSSSARRPHFAGPAYVRRGSESVAATEEVYRDLLLAQDDKRRYLLDHKDALWTVEYLNKAPGEAQSLFDTRARSQAECKVEEVTAFFVRLRNTSGTASSEMLQDVHISYDDTKHRPRMVIWPTGRG